MKKILILLLISMAFAVAAAPYTLVEVTDEYAVFIEDYEGISIPVDTVIAIHQPGTSEHSDSTFITYVTVIDVQGDRVFVQKINTASPIQLEVGMSAIPRNSAYLPPDRPAVVEDPADTEDNGGFEELVEEEETDDSEYVREVNVSNDVTDFLQAGVRISVPYVSENDPAIDPSQFLGVRGSIGLKTDAVSVHFVGGAIVLNSWTYITSGINGRYHLGPLFVGAGAEKIFYITSDKDNEDSGFWNVYGEAGLQFQIADATYLGIAGQVHTVPFAVNVPLRPSVMVEAGIMF